MTRQQTLILLDKTIKNLSKYKIKNYQVQKYIKSQITILSLILDSLLKDK